MAFISALPSVASATSATLQPRHAICTCTQRVHPLRLASGASGIRRSFHATETVFSVRCQASGGLGVATKERAETLTIPSFEAPEPAPSEEKIDDPFSIDDDDLLHSTPFMRAVVGVHYGLTAAVLYRTYDLLAQGSSGAASIGLAALAAYVLSDLGTGIYHWAVDNYGDKRTPLVGRQIAGFQGHHRDPIVITKREFCNNVYKICQALSIPGLTLTLLANSGSAGANAFWALFVNLIVMSQMTHAWSHMSHPPPAAEALQKAGILVSRFAHGAHHVSPYHENYCIVSGWWNPLLDRSGFFRALERAVYAATGVKPRSWLGGDRPPVDPRRA